MASAQGTVTDNEREAWFLKFIVSPASPDASAAVAGLSLASSAYQYDATSNDAVRIEAGILGDVVRSSRGVELLAGALNGRMQALTEALSASGESSDAQAELGRIERTLDELRVHNVNSESLVTLGSLVPRGTPDRITAMIRSYSAKVSEAWTNCTAELRTLDGEIAVLKKELEAAREAAQEASAQISAARDAVSEGTDSAAITEAVAADLQQTLSEGQDSAQDVTAHVSAAQAAGVKVEQTVEDARETIAAANTPAAPFTDGEWVMAAHELQRQGTDFYKLVDLEPDKFVSDKGKLHQGRLPTELRTPEGLAAILKLQHNAVRRAEALQKTTKTTLFEAAQRIASALRALHAALEVTPEKRPVSGFMRANGPIDKLVKNIINAEYRIQYSFQNNEDTLRELTTEMDASLNWAATPATTVTRASNKFKEAGHEAYAKPWDDFAISSPPPPSLMP